MDVSTLLTIALWAPLVSAVAIALFLRRAGALASAVSVLAALVIAGCSLYALSLWDGAVITASMTWLTLGDFSVQMGYLFDDKAAIMLFVVGFVGFLIHVFSLGYMHDDEAKARYFAGLSIFMFSMMGIILADNLIMLFVFWELVGFSSYMLIAHYWKTDAAAAASKKAFIVNRVGDFGFLIGIVWCYHHFGTVNLADLELLVGAQDLQFYIALLLICGFLGKSAQFPLHVWLADAMAGPTPVSALIHAATMVAAGIYFVARIFFLIPEGVQDVMLWLCAAMTLYAGLCALGQRDIKKILAYSTLSQLGYMGVALGLGLPGLAIFHMACHAFFKALLFLGSGSVIHACHHEQDIFKMGGLWKRMPVTTITFAIGVLALCGVMFFSGYYSKDAILEAAYLENQAVFVVVMASAFLTAIYMGRLFWIAFMGQPNSEHAERAHESSWVMLLPLLLLAALSIVGGYKHWWPETMSSVFAGDLHDVHQGIAEASAKSFFLIISTAAWVFGLVFSFFFYGAGAGEDRLARVAGPVYRLFASKLWIDEVYNGYVKYVQQRVADVLHAIDLVLISGLFVRGTAGLVGLLGIVSRSLHVGSVHVYVYWFLLGLVFLGLYALGIF